MQDKPILFSGEMVRAILRKAKPKGATRRIMKKQPPDNMDFVSMVGVMRPCDYALFSNAFYATENENIVELKVTPPYRPGDRLWVREKFRAPLENDAYSPSDMPLCPIRYEADGEIIEATDIWNFPLKPEEPWGRVRQSIFMPRWASRITLEVTEVWPERLRDITEEEAILEGIRFDGSYWLGGLHPVKGSYQCWPTARRAFQALWDQINGPRGFGWDKNPWVWRYGFKRIES